MTCFSSFEKSSENTHSRRTSTIPSQLTEHFDRIPPNSMSNHQITGTTTDRSLTEVSVADTKWTAVSEKAQAPEASAAKQPPIVRSPGRRRSVGSISNVSEARSTDSRETTDDQSDDRSVLSVEPALEGFEPTSTQGVYARVTVENHEQSVFLYVPLDEASTAFLGNANDVRLGTAEKASLQTLEEERDSLLLGTADCNDPDECEVNKAVIKKARAFWINDTFEEARFAAEARGDLEKEVNDDPKQNAAEENEGQRSRGPVPDSEDTPSIADPGLEEKVSGFRSAVITQPI